MAVGKNFLENITVAMYENSFTIYREFIQNAADSIDKAIARGIIKKDEAYIDIHIEYNKRKISVFDNACGIPMREFKKKMMDVADSDKDRDKEKGFRGIGRLAGLGYCDKLIFHTSARGEEKESIITWNGIKLREIVNDPSQHPSSEQLIDEITNVEYVVADKEEHFFEVIMEDVSFESDDLLDEQQVIKYLSAVAPVPYANYFIFSSKIKEFAKENSFRIDEYNVSVNGNQLFKPYRTILYEGHSNDDKKEYDQIYDVEFKIFKDPMEKVIAWMWFGIAKFEKVIPTVNEMRCIRLRKENIQIGDENTMGKFFKQERGNSYYIGEVFAVDNNLIPNARRDYFNPNPSAKKFEESLHNFFYLELYNLYYYASKVRGAQKAVVNFKKKEREYNSKLQNAGFIDTEEQKAAQKEIETEKSKLEKAKREIENRKKDANANEMYNRVFTEIEKTYKTQKEEPHNVNILQNDQSDKGKKYLTQSLSKYSKREQKLITRIYNIIKMMLPKDMADMVIKKIQEELSK